jgi:hypothetical protein
MGSLYSYLTAIAPHWWAFMMAFPFIIDEALKWIFPTARNWLANRLAPTNRRRIEIGLMLLGVFVGGFLAWQDEHNARVEAYKRVEDWTLKGGWYLSEMQWQRMQAGLHLSPDEHYEFQINSSPSCDNCELFAEKLRETLNQTPGWTAGGGPLVFAGSKWKRGLWIVMRVEDEKARPISVLDTAFSYASIPLIHDFDNTMPERSFVIIVARSPQ